MTSCIEELQLRRRTICPEQGQRPLGPKNEKGSVLRDTLTSCQRDIA